MSGTWVWARYLASPVVSRSEHVFPAVQVSSDGPALYIRFTVPGAWCHQTKRFDASSRQYEAMETAGVLQPGPLQLSFEVHEAYDKLMVQPSPMRPALNVRKMSDQDFK